MAATRNTSYYELALVHPDADSTTPPVYDDYSDAIDAVDVDDTVPVPDGPGLCVDYDWDYVFANVSSHHEYA